MSWGSEVSKPLPQTRLCTCSSGVVWLWEGSTGICLEKVKWLYQRQTPGLPDKLANPQCCCSLTKKSSRPFTLCLSTYLKNPKFLLPPSIRRQHKCASVDYEIWTQKSQNGEVIGLKYLFFFWREGWYRMTWKTSVFHYIFSGKKVMNKSKYHTSLIF